MTEFQDKFPDLSQTVDIGGDRYFTGKQKPIELGFKNRIHFLNAFGNNSETEYLLRKYMYYSLKDKKKLVFDTPEEKEKLLAILKKHVKQIKTNPLYNSPILKNTLIRRSCLNIEQLIQELEGSNTTNKEPTRDFFKFMDVDILPCTKAKKYIKQITDDHKFQMILEMAWYLLHPDKIPAEIECDWAKLIKKLDTLRLGDIVEEIRKADTSIEPSKNAFNYFKKINLQTVAKSDTIKNALDQAKKFATEIQDSNAKNEVKNRLKLLLNILEMKKYLANDLPIDEDKMKIISSDAQSNTIQRSIITNPMRGGGTAMALNKPLGIAMKPLYDYFKVMYDPIYSFLETSIQTYPNKKDIIIPELTTLLHICNNLNPSAENIYGVYRLSNVDSELLQFINTMIKTTREHISTIKNEETKNTFNKQLFSLPKIRLSTITGVSNSSSKNNTTLPCIQFFTMGTNINLMSKSNLKEDTNNAVKDFYKEGYIYIVCTKSENITENIPINVYDIDYNTVDISGNSINIDNIPDNYFNKNKNILEGELYLENLVDITPYAVYNDAELALSIFIAFKELMPK